jgi:hypothetical protein
MLAVEISRQYHRKPAGSTDFIHRAGWQYVRVTNTQMGLRSIELALKLPL